MAKTAEYPEITDPTGAKLLATTSGGSVGNISTDKFARSDNVVESIQNGTGINVDTSDPRNPIVGVDTEDLFDKNTDTLDDIGDGSTYKRMTDAEKTKVGFVTVTGAVDLDAMDTKLDGIESGADVTDAGNVGSAIHNATPKTTPADADTVALIDSAASNVLKKLSWTNIKATLKTYFDTLYATVAHTHTFASLTSKPTTLSGYGITDAQAANANLDDISALADPNADRIVFWDDSANEIAYLTIGANLSISGTTISATGGGGGGGGDMYIATYDPNGVSSDAFDMDNMVEGTSTKIMTGAERTKLSGIASGATANSPDATLLDRANHTGTQTLSTVSDAGALAAKSAVNNGDWSGTDLAVVNGGTGASDASGARTNLGLAIGSDVLAYDAALASIAGLTLIGGKIVYTAATDTFVTADITEAGLAILDDADAAAQRTTLGLGTGNSPQFTAINVGHASDTTVTRASSGRLAVEGNNVLMANDIGTSVQGYDADTAKLDVEDQMLTGGAGVTLKDLSNLSGASITPDPRDRPTQKVTNNGAGSILPGSNYGSYRLLIVNASGAGAITTTGWIEKGDSFDTTVGSKFLCSADVYPDMAVLNIQKVA
ncbi:MAG: hypothetical protein R3D70_09340 [Rhizobiaceae bacterium]